MPKSVRAATCEGGSGSQGCCRGGSNSTQAAAERFGGTARERDSAYDHQAHAEGHSRGGGEDS